jgi:peroxiredoxin 2/4
MKEDRVEHFDLTTIKGDFVMDEKTSHSIPRIGDVAPDFEAQTTAGIIKLDDFNGQWLVLFSHPMDFTPVCTSEFISFARQYENFKKLGAALIGLSVDGVYSHIAWLRNIKEKFNVSIPFPVIADHDASIANLYGMIMPNDLSTATSRCLFVIDPNKIIRATIYYPFTTGRNIEEVLRLIHALQVSDKHGVGTPANWQPGEPVIEFPPLTHEESENIEENGITCNDWYYRTRNL